MSTYADKIAAVTAHRRSLARLSDVFSSKSEALDRSVVGEFLRDTKAKAPSEIDDHLGTVVGLAAGAVLWKQHRFLGGIGGASLGRNLPALLNPLQRNNALCNMGQTGAAILGARLLPKNSIAGFVLGWLAGGAAIYFGGLRR